MFKITIKTGLFFILILSSNSQALTSETENTQAEIRYLLNHIEASGCIFNRNHTAYRASEAVEHIKKKYDYFRDEIDTTEDFITLSATKSELSGRRYTVRCNGDKTQYLGTWLLNILDGFRQNQQR